MSEKVVGYSLLAAGVIVIVFAALNVYSVFTKKTRPVDLFDFPSIKISSSALMPQQETDSTPVNITPTDIEVLPGDVLNKTSNILAHLLLMGFIAGIGSRIANIGVSLARNIEVKIKPDNFPTKDGK